MDNLQNCEENIHEDILDEGVERSVLINSLHLETKLSQTPFDPQPRINLLRKTFSGSGVRQGRELCARIFGSSCDAKVALLKKVSARTQPSTKNIHNDVRELLQKAIKLRNSESVEVELDVSPKFGSNQCSDSFKQMSKEVTVGDLLGPFC
ncbi:unnamed protein product [Moneuplotes crassus]|uniref:Uncharacterized protein n=1 Tax=Euplotes crassus TaxID=5936 RepID=A0AAD1UFZ9_EUPCR|nr:unnamed protein product [Moneuplotes crassus]